MRITGTGPLNSTSNLKKKKNVQGAGGFDGLLSGSSASEGTQHVNNAYPADTVDSLLALQEVGDNTPSPQRSVTRGFQLLDHLEEIRDGLLMGRLSEQHIRNLSTTIAQSRDSTIDPKLNAILDEIEVRAAVELAKLSF